VAHVAFLQLGGRQLSNFERRGCHRSGKTHESNGLQPLALLFRKKKGCDADDAVDAARPEDQLKIRPRKAKPRFFEQSIPCFCD